MSLQELSLNLLRAQTELSHWKFESYTPDQKLEWCNRYTDAYYALAEFKKKALLQDDSTKYFVTLTKNAQATKDSWFNALTRVLKYKWIHSFEASLEHITTNIHCHALLSTPRSIRKRDFVNFPGFVDFKKVSKDNGIRNYMTKENKIFSDIISLTTFYHAIQEEN